MNTKDIERLQHSKIESEIQKIIRNHWEVIGGTELQEDLVKLLEIVEEEKRKSWALKDLAFELANKL